MKWKAPLACAAALSLALVGTTPAAAAEGAPSIGDSLFAGIGNTGYDVTHYDVNLTYSEDGTVEAVTTITATASEELTSFYLDFEGMEVDAVQVNGTDATWDRTEDPDNFAFKLQITPAEAVSGEFTVQVAYSGQPVTHIDPDGSSEGWVATPDGATALGQPIGTMTWIPSNNTPADKATFDITVNAPTLINGLPAAVASNGELASQEELDDGTTTWSWKQERQQSTMATMLSIGNYDVHEDTVTLLDGSEIPEWTFVDSSLSDETKATIQDRRAEFESIIHFFEERFGKYPGGSTGIVVDITSLGYALETQDRSYFERGVSRGTLIHEFAHQWFGDSVSPADWNSIWISEGMASLSSQYYVHEVDGTGPTSTESYYNQYVGTDADSSRWDIPAGNMGNGANLFGWQTYNRSSMMLEVLREVLGEDQWIELLNTYHANYLGQSATTVEFQALAEEISGKDLDELFTDWLIEPGKPDWPAVYTLEQGVTFTRTGLAPIHDNTVTVNDEVWTLPALDSATFDVTCVESVTASTTDVGASPQTLEYSQDSCGSVEPPTEDDGDSAAQPVPPANTEEIAATGSEQPLGLAALLLAAAAGVLALNARVRAGRE